MRLFSAQLSMVALVAASVSACSDGDDSKTDPNEEANQSIQASRSYFWEAFAGQHHDRAKEATRRLEESYAQAPTDAGNTLRLAHSYLWRMAEFGRGPAPDVSEIPLLASNAERYFSEAAALAPKDARIAGWLGPVKLGNAAQRGDMAGVAEGMAIVEDGVKRYPEFNLFVAALINAGEPRDSERFASAVDAVWRTIDVCAGADIDRDEPDFSRLVTRTLAKQVDPVCANTTLVTHGFEGFFLFFGDVLTKANQVEQARRAYAVAREIPDYDDWPYREVLSAHEEQIEARAALFANTDPADDPLLVSQEPFNCSYCHAAAK